MEGLATGRIVHYTAYNLTPLAAIVMGIWDQEHGTVNLAVFTDMPNAAGMLNFGLQFHREVEYAAEPKPGTWHWPAPGVVDRSRSASHGVAISSGTGETISALMRIVFVQTLGGGREVLEEHVPSAQAIARKLYWEQALSGAVGAAIVIEPHTAPPTEGAARESEA